MTAILVVATGALAVLSILVSPRVRSSESFFLGMSETGQAPGLWPLVFSQVTTWIFARSLLNAAILGYLFGIAGTIAYAVYYGSFLVGAFIVDAIRFRHGHASVQSYLRAHFGTLGEWTFNVLVTVRLVSEVFANLLVVGIIFGVAGTVPYAAAILAVTLFTLAYSMMGGLRASLRTDVLRMTILLVLLAVLIVIIVRQPGFDPLAILASSPDLTAPGWVLLAVALVQVWSYPLHDPVMMDRGFLADRATTRRSFHYAFWLSTACILAFGLIGVFAGLHRGEGEALMETLGRMLAGPALLMVNLALVVSAVSTLDSALSSASKLAVVDMRIAAPTPGNGRIAMAAFMGGGLALLFFGPSDLFTAVAISGTAALFLAPVIFFCIWGGMRVPLWSYGAAFALAMTGSGVYFLDSSGHLPVMAHLFGPLHDYTRLLIVNVAVLAGGCAAFALGILSSGPQPRRSAA